MENLQLILEIMTVACLGTIIGCGVYVLGVRAGVKAATPPAIEPLPPETQAALKTQTLIVSEWQKWNPWYGDPVLALEAQSVHLALQRDNPGQPLEDNLADVTLEMRRRHPEIATLN